MGIRQLAARMVAAAVLLAALCGAVGCVNVDVDADGYIDRWVSTEPTPAQPPQVRPTDLR